MKVAFRVDASQETGTGHLMRCLCLADQLRAGGAAVRFVSRPLPDHLRNQVGRHGYEITFLPKSSASRPSPETSWSEEQQSQDAQQTLAVLADVGVCDLVIVDHYGLGLIWETAIRKAGSRLMVVDDLGRSHDCEVLLDQNFYADPVRRYSGRVPAACELLLGPRFALLRSEFAEARGHVQAREGDVRRLVIFLGGVDAGNVTETVLRAFRFIGRGDIAVDVVIGQTHPARERIEGLCNSMRETTCHVQTSNMAALLARADLAVGAGGSAIWERCVLGVPSLTLCLAGNQRELLVDGSRHGFAYVPDETPISEPSLSLHIRALLANSGLRHHLSRAGMALVDGKGAQRVAGVLARGSVSIRLANADDCAAIHAWRNDAAIRSVSRDTNEVPFEDHQRWFDDVLRSGNRHLLIGEWRGGGAVGVVRFDVNDSSAEVSIYLVPSRLGHGEGSALLLTAEDWLRSEHPEIDVINAEVLASNAPSQRLFERCGYQRQSAKFSKGLRV